MRKSRIFCIPPFTQLLLESESNVAMQDLPPILLFGVDAQYGATLEEGELCGIAGGHLGGDLPIEIEADGTDQIETAL
jgi:hypothetical protein